MGKTCRGPDCRRDGVLDGLCGAHYRQQLRKRPLRPLRIRTADSRSRIGVRVSGAGLRGLEAEAKRRGLPVARIASDAIEAKYARAR